MTAGGTPDLPQIRIFIGEVKASATPLLIQTLLGSCVTVCLHDPGTGIGGMNHILLPHGSSQGVAARFGVHAMELLINEMMRLGANRKRYVAKAFGGGNLIACLRSPTVGESNVEFVERFLQAEAIPILASRFGGTTAIHVYFQTDTGTVRVRQFENQAPNTLVAQEDSYRREVKRRFAAACDPVLF